MKALKTLTIGDVTLENRYILAPMAGITNLPFRLICKGMGAGMVCMEMVSAKAISFDNKKTFDMLRTDENEHPVSLQLFGSDANIICDMAKRIEEYAIDIFDINMGCPAPKVVKNGDGSALLKDPLRAASIIEKTAGSINKPLTVKIRIGFDDNINAVEMAKIAEQSGASAITVHGRTREQYYSGKANWDIIGEVKRAVSIPVIANGDIKGPKDIEILEKDYHVDGFMIGRAAQGNPWIFKELCYYEATGETLERPSIKEVIEIIRHHGNLLVEHKGEYIGIQEMRKHVAWYLSGYKNAASARRRLNGISSFDELNDLLDNFLEDISDF